MGRLACIALLAMQLLGDWFVIAAQAQTGGEPETDKQAKPIPVNQIGAVVAKQYSGDGLSVVATPEGARLRCAFQKMDGEATREGLWLTSTAEGAGGDKFRVVAAAVGRRNGPCPALPATGKVEVKEKLVRFLRPGLVEEYSVSVDGVRQDFIVENPPAGTGQLRVELAVSGAGVEPLVDGARLVLVGSGRKLNYSRLKVTDANGKELAARMEVAGQPKAQNPTAEPGLVVLVDDAEAAYPIRIDPTFSDANWVSMGGLPGANDAVYAAVVDGSGNLYIGGAFTMVGDIIANGVAKWNGTTWSALGSGMTGGTPHTIVSTLAMSGGDVYAGGCFTTAGGIMANNIAKWNGSTWSALGMGMNSNVWALAVSGGDVFAGGAFTNAGGNAASCIAKWNGSTWSTLGSGMSGTVAALAVSGSDLYAGGNFTNAGGSVASCVAKWDGSAWSALGLGISGIVITLAVSGGDVYAGGFVATNGGSTVGSIAKWNGNTWSVLDPGPSGIVRALAASGGDLYAGGEFYTAGGVVVSSIAKWNGNAWSALGSGMGSDEYLPIITVLTLAVSGSNVYAGGVFSTAGGSTARHIAKWNGNTWSALGSGMPGISSPSASVSALAVLGTDLYVAGNFTNAGGRVANNIAKWDGGAWSALGAGVNGPVAALAASGSDVYAAGAFTMAGGITANRVAKWNGSVWSALGSGISAPPGNPYYGGAVNDLAVSGSDVYAGGAFTTAGGTAATNIARWNGSAWSALGSGMDSRVSALAVSGSDVYAGGWFTNAGGVAANYIAKWDGSAWSALGSGMNGNVSALAVSGSNVYAGGTFSWVGGIWATNIAKWNGNSWGALGSGIAGGVGVYIASVNALAVSGSDVYAGGAFTTAGGTAAANIAKWNGTAWSAQGSGANSFVRALALFGNNLYVGGQFTAAGGKVSTYVAKANTLFIASSNDSAGFTNGHFSFGLIGPTGSNAVIQVSTNLQSWTPLLTNSLPGGSLNFIDPQATNSTRRFYRALLKP